MAPRLAILGLLLAGCAGERPKGVSRHEDSGAGSTGDLGEGAELGPGGLEGGGPLGEAGLLPEGSKSKSDLGGKVPNKSDQGSKAADQGTPGAIWQPKPGTSWQWQLSGTLDTSVNVQMYDIDLFESSAQTIAGLHAKGRKVICYFDTAYEPGRPDSSSFTPAVLGNNMKGWPGERWVDIRSQVVRDIMTKRMDLAVQKGCDGIEADDLDVMQNNPGFPITASDQLDFCKFLATQAHARKLSIALKNNIDQVAQLVSYFDFAVNEECFQYNECNTLKPFISAGKAVFQVEYGGQSLASSVCPKANALNFDTLIKNLDLDAFRIACR